SAGLASVRVVDAQGRTVVIEGGVAESTSAAMALTDAGRGEYAGLGPEAEMRDIALRMPGGVDADEVEYLVKNDHLRIVVDTHMRQAIPEFVMPPIYVQAGDAGRLGFAAVFASMSDAVRRLRASRDGDSFGRIFRGGDYEFDDVLETDRTRVTWTGRPHSKFLYMQYSYGAEMASQYDVLDSLYSGMVQRGMRSEAVGHMGDALRFGTD
ncbi:hypothetical protein KIH74_35660, partial [Kineosporia sp. J2-2]